MELGSLRVLYFCVLFVLKFGNVTTVRNPLEALFFLQQKFGNFCFISVNLTKTFYFLGKFYQISNITKLKRKGNKKRTLIRKFSECWMMRSPKFHPDNVEKEDKGIEQQETKDWKSKIFTHSFILSKKWKKRAKQNKTFGALKVF